jgi:hypothetical protein
MTGESKHLERQTWHGHCVLPPLLKIGTSQRASRPCVTHFTVFFTTKLKVETNSKNMHKALDCLERTLPLPATTPLPAEG